MELINTFKKSYNIVSILYILFGLVMLIWPKSFSVAICYAFGIITIIYGIVHLINYFVKDNMAALFRYDLVIGVIGVILGIFVLIRPVFILSILPFVLGIFLLFSSIMKLQNAVDLKRMEYEKWWIVLVFVLCSTILGIILIINPLKSQMVMVMFIGASLIIDGVMNLWSMFYIIKKVKQLQKEKTQDIVDVD